MLTSANQYLRPEYLSPLPTTLDAKKSPLALLAQTCSNIGADNPNNKPIISGLEKSKDSSNDSKKSKSPVIISDDHSNSKPSFKPYESVIKKEKDENANTEFGGKKSPSSKTSSPSVISRVSPAASTGTCGKSSPATSENGRNSSHNPIKSESQISARTSPLTSDSTAATLSSTQTTLCGLGYGSSSSLGLDLGRSDAAKDNLSMGLSAYKALNGLNPLSNCCPPGHPMDVHAYQAAAQNGLLKGANYPLGALSPYVGYARVKTAGGGTSLVPVCRDPYCTNCQFSMHNAQLASCPSGCTQCNHDRLAPTLPGLGHGLVPGLTGSAAAMAAVAAAGGSIPGISYPHSVFPRPNVCSWMVGDTYCGKRFNTSEELLQHLRTHTILATSESSLSLMNPAFSLSSASLNAACHMHYSTAGSLTSPAGLRRYPTSLSPVSSLSAASRYHPYKPFLSSLPGSQPLPQLGHPGLGMYYPYGIYGQRLGPPVHQ